MIGEIEHNKVSGANASTLDCRTTIEVLKSDLAEIKAMLAELVARPSVDD